MSAAPDEVEIPLLGGDVTDGVVRVGQTVRRPVGDHSPIVRQVLNYLEQQGFSGAPRYLGIDSKGRDMLTYVEGEVAGRPWPAWTAAEERIISVARLVRAYDDAIASFGLPESVTDLVVTPPDPDGCPPSLGLAPELMGHRDITPENVVFRDGAAFALIDFDFVRPASRLDEVSSMLLWWAPMMPSDDREVALRDVDAFARARLLVDAYGLEDRARLVEHFIRQTERTWFLMRRRAEDLGGGWQRMWDEGVGDRITRRTAWIKERADELNDVLTR